MNKQVIAMGFFDGVHLGHQAVIKKAAELAKERNLELSVLTYDPHPSIVFSNNTDFKYLSLKEEKEEMLEHLEVKNLFYLKLEKNFSLIDGQSFVDNVLLKLNPAIVIAGFNHYYGVPKSESNMQNLPKFAKETFEVITVNEFQNQNQKVSSTEIRELIKLNKIDNANKLLGFNYFVQGEVIHGNARGRTLDFPTINVQVAKNKLIPNEGVYVTITEINGKQFKSMTSIGNNPTFSTNDPVTIETNIFDFNKNIYGQKVRIYFIDFLRSQIKFNDVDELIKQLKKDQIITKNFLK
jgi:riboflavin kinase/FMN adenylyltransferase